jgi:hypothetical protein
MRQLCEGASSEERPSWIMYVTLFKWSKIDLDESGRSHLVNQRRRKIREQSGDE